MFKFSIETRQNLLAFSGGVDSSALFFLLLESNIPFDIAIVDYGLREASKDEVIYATQLAHKYNKKCFISTFPKELLFSEKTARDYRYNFFDELMQEHSYETLLTAHQLNDRLEWFLMQLSRGAGISELLGMKEIVTKNGYMIQRPLLNYSKEQLQEYLDVNNFKYFVDETNMDQSFKRNYFRHNFSNHLIDEFQDGIKRSFEYLENDEKSFLSNVDKQVNRELHIYTFNGDINLAINLIDKDLKERGVLLTKKTRDEISTQKELVVSHKYAVAITGFKIYIAPYLNLSIEKKFKERCRIGKIPRQIRPYISTLSDFIF